jgi:hypothetical protein
MFTTKYMKNQPKPAKRQVKKYGEGGYVDPEVQTDENEIDAQTAIGRVEEEPSNYVKDRAVIRESGDRSNGRSSPEQAINKIAAQGRDKAANYYARKDIGTIISGGRK